MRGWEKCVGPFAGEAAVCSMYQYTVNFFFTRVFSVQKINTETPTREIGPKSHPESGFSGGCCFWACLPFIVLFFAYMDRLFGIIK